MSDVNLKKLSKKCSSLKEKIHSEQHPKQRYDPLLFQQLYNIVVNLRKYFKKKINI